MAWRHTIVNCENGEGEWWFCNNFDTWKRWGKTGSAMTPTDAVAQERSFAIYLASRLATIALIAQVGGRVSRLSHQGCQKLKSGMNCSSTVSCGRHRKDKEGSNMIHKTCQVLWECPAWQLVRTCESWHSNCFCRSEFSNPLNQSGKQMQQRTSIVCHVFSTSRGVSR